MSVLEFGPMVVTGSDGQDLQIVARKYEGIPVSKELCGELGGVTLRRSSQAEVPDLSAKVSETVWPISYFDPLIVQFGATD